MLIIRQTYRKTGLTIPENARDELGIEAIGGIFSSPKKSSPARVSTRATRVAPPHQQNGYVDEDIEMSDADGDEMEFASTVGRVLQGPMEDLRVFSSSKGKISLPPPRARSPMKTSLGSSPRRPPSMPPVSSPVPPSRRGYVANPISSSPRKDVEERLTGQSKAVNRRLNFSMDNSTPRGADGSVAKRKSSLRNEAFPPRDGAESSVKKGRVARTSPLRPRHELQQVGDRSKGNKRGLVQMSRDEAEDEEDLSESEIFDAIAQESYQDAGQDMDSYEHGGNSAGGAGDYDDEEVDQEQPSYDEEQEPRSAKTKANAKSDSSKSAGRRGAKATAAEEPQATFPVQKRGRGRPPKRSLPVDDTPADSSQLAEQQEPPSERPAKRGRPAKATKAPKGKVPPSQRNPNARIVSRRTSTAHEGSPGPAQSPKPKTSRKRKSTEVEALTALAARSNYRPHLLAAPDEDPTAVKTRSGRTAVKPMEWWRNEKAIYTDGNSLVAIVRTEEVVKTRKIAGWSKKGGRRRARLEEEEEEEEEAEMEEWEREPGIVMGEVKDWDANLAPGAEVEVIETGGFFLVIVSASGWACFADSNDRTCLCALGHRYAPSPVLVIQILEDAWTRLFWFGYH